MAGCIRSVCLLSCLLMATQFPGLAAGQFYQRVVDSTAHSPRLQVIDKVVKYRGQYEHFALPPQRNASGPVRVMFSLGLIRIVNFDQVNMILTFVALERYNWMDMSFVYKDSNPAPIVLPTSGMWMPDLKVIGGLTPDMDVDHSVRPLVYGTGEIMYLPKVKHVVGCSQSGAEYVCELNFNSWHYSSNQVEPDFFGRSAGWDMSNAEQHPLWRVAGSDARKRTSTAKGNTDNFVYLKYTLRISKK